MTTYENFRYRYDKKVNPHNRGIFPNIGETLCGPLPASRNNFRAVVEESEAAASAVQRVPQADTVASAAVASEAAAAAEREAAAEAAADVAAEASAGSLVLEGKWAKGSHRCQRRRRKRARARAGRPRGCASGSWPVEDDEGARSTSSNPQLDMEIKKPRSRTPSPLALGLARLLAGRPQLRRCGGDEAAG